MGFLELPKVDRIRTPGFIENLDGFLEAKLSCGGFTSAGVNWRMWILYGFQLFFLCLCVAIGATIQNGVGDLGGVFNAVDILRLVGGIPGILAAILAGIGFYIRMRYLLMSAVVLDMIAFVFLFLSWAMDAADAVDLGNRVANPPTVPRGVTPVDFTGPRDKATTSCIFGVLGWLVTIFTFYLTYATYQEMNGVAAKAPKVKEPKSPKQQEQGSISPKQQEQSSIPTKKISSPTPKSSPQPVSKVNAPKPQGNPASRISKASIHHCPQCSAEWPIDVKFCGECGSKIPDLVAESPTNSAPTGPNWEEHFTEDGFMYYYNPKTGESKWAEA